MDSLQIEFIGRDALTKINNNVLVSFLFRKLTDGLTLHTRLVSIGIVEVANESPRG